MVNLNWAIIIKEIITCVKKKIISLHNHVNLCVVLAQGVIVRVFYFYNSSNNNLFGNVNINKAKSVQIFFCYAQLAFESSIQLGLIIHFSDEWIISLH